jgi:hypothetical protein
VLGRSILSSLRSPLGKYWPALRAPDDAALSGATLYHSALGMLPHRSQLQRKRLDDVVGTNPFWMVRNSWSVDLTSRRENRF